MVDIHVYVIPNEFWRDSLNSVSSDAVIEALSAGFVHVDPEITLAAIRRDIYEQLQTGTVPSDFCFLRIVGRCLAKVSEKQEVLLKAKSFLPPYTFSPDIYLIDSRVTRRGAPRSTGSNSDGFSLPRLTPNPHTGALEPESFPLPKVIQLNQADLEQQKLVPNHSHIGPKASIVVTNNGYDGHVGPKASTTVTNGGYDGYAGDIAHFDEQQPEKRSHDRLDDVELYDNSISNEPDPPPAEVQLPVKLEIAKRERTEHEVRRKSLLKKLHELQDVVQHKRKEAHEYWRSRFVEEKGRTPYLEDQAATLGKDIDNLHKKLVRQLGNNSNVDTTVLTRQLHALKLRQTVDLLKLKVEEGHTKLMCQIRLRNQAETELRAMRAELTQKKVLLQLLKSKLPADFA